MKPPIASEMVKGVFCSWDCALDDSGVRMFLNGHLSLQGLCFLLLSIVVGGQALEVRLKGGRHRCEGRVEMKHQGTWGMVYFEYWFLDAAEIVCGHLKCGHAVDAPRGVYFGPTVGPIWTFSLQCNNTEAGVTFNLNDCTAAEVKNYDHIMSHDQDIGAVCSGNQTQVLPQCHDSVSEPGGSAASEGSPANCSDSRRLRLADGGGRCAGRVEILHQGSWGTICDDGWDLTDAHVVCRQLGCGQAVDASPLARFGAGSGPIWLDELNCTGKEPHVWRCPSRGWGRHDCRHKEDAGVVCSEFLALRMVSEDQECAGWLEVFYNGTWGSVCRSRMDEITLSIEEKPELSNCGPLPGERTTLPPATAGTRPRSNLIPGIFSLPGILCLILGTLLFLVLVILVTQLLRWRAERRALSTVKGAVHEAVYEEIDQLVTPKEDLLRSSDDSMSQLPYYAGDAEEDSDHKSTPEPLDQRTEAPSEGYDDAEEVPLPEAPPASRMREVEVPPEEETGMRPSQTDSSLNFPREAADPGKGEESPWLDQWEKGDPGYDDVELSVPGTPSVAFP
ncbi:Antigen WC1.1 [Camelus dromedarius]|uniref:Antigen WC1.1 n=1 Tax=Camelus dromedarius TaxID=9838 RepID=A0A5N4C637_CAMDR|nr:Antigen WC1.1 [Camelus dromedarius]